MKIFALILACFLAGALPSFAADKHVKAPLPVQESAADPASPLFEDVAPQAGTDTPSSEAPPTLELTPQDEEAAALFTNNTSTPKP